MHKQTEQVAKMKKILLFIWINPTLKTRKLQKITAGKNQYIDGNNFPLFHKHNNFRC